MPVASGNRTLERMRKFNTAGVCLVGRHYMIEPESRLPEARGLIDQRGYFVVHAPRQTGKTTTLRALAQALTAEGRYAALHFTCEVGEPFSNDVAAAERVVCKAMINTAVEMLPAELHPPPLQGDEPGLLLSTNLTAWAQACPKPLVLIFDEIDALRGDSLKTVLRQLKAGYGDRPTAFPASVVLCGLRDVRDYKAQSGGDPSRFGSASPFNIKLKSLRMGDFDEAELRLLYGQHTEETGQPFTEEALEHAWALSFGQPWLVNALAREVTQEIRVPLTEPITPEHLDDAKERLIRARETHIDSLADRLKEKPVRRVVEPLIAGRTVGGLVYNDDCSYVRDLGLIAPDKPVRVANPIYREVIVRVLADAAEDNVTADPRSYVLSSGKLDFERLLQEFSEFWIEHGEVLASTMTYHEVAPQLVLMAYLHRIVNSGGHIDREYGVGRGRIDLLVRWPYTGTPDGVRKWQREALELKVWAEGKADPLERGLAQLDGYLEGLSLDSGVLVIFDRRPDARPIASRTRFEQAATPSGRAVKLLRA